MLPERGDGYLRTAEAARLVGVKPATMSKWRERGHIAPDGLDERGRPLYLPETARAAERGVRERGIATSGLDPRRLRHASLNDETPPVAERSGNWRGLLAS